MFLKRKQNTHWRGYVISLLFLKIWENGFLLEVMGETGDRKTREKYYLLLREMKELSRGESLT